MEKSVTFTGACANEIKPNGLLARLLTKRKKEVMLESEINWNNPKCASFEENHLMTKTRDALRTTSIFKFRSLTNNLNFWHQS
jgi:hypothetical protein